MPPPPQKATIKQAKASYRQRGLPTISDSERRQLQRASKLDERAQRIKEQERRRQEAFRKRIEKEKQQRQVEETRLGSQLRCDKFGFKSSQAHLGAFFGAGSKLLSKPPGHVRSVQGKPNIFASGSRSDLMVVRPCTAGPDSMSEEFDDELDDQSLLEADAGSIVAFPPSIKDLPPYVTSVTLSHQTSIQASSSKHEDVDPVSENLDWLDLELDSSTQIARELSAIPRSSSGSVTGAATNYSPFSSGGFDLSMEDIEALDPQSQAVSEVARDRAAMPPPPIPMHSIKHAQRPASRLEPSRAAPASCPNLTTSKPVLPLKVETGFSPSQLEQLIDDDIQLTQAPTG